jgi:hypothetical protein
LLNSNFSEEDSKEIIEERKQEIRREAALVHVFFKSVGITLYKREELFGVIDIISKQIKPPVTMECGCNSDVKNTVQIWSETFRNQVFRGE